MTMVVSFDGGDKWLCLSTLTTGSKGTELPALDKAHSPGL